MNNKEIIEINELKKEKREIKEELKQLMNFLNNYRHSFNYKESISALERIHKYFCKQCDRETKIDEEIQTIADKIGVNCKHRILVEIPLSHECPICKKIYTYRDSLPDTTEYIISDYKYDKESNKLDEIVLASSNEETANEAILAYFNNLQYSQNVKIKIRRKTNEN